MRYWSTTTLLIVDAYALSGPDWIDAAESFSQDEVAEGEYLYFHQEDNLSGKANYRLRIRSALPIGWCSIRKTSAPCGTG